MNDAQKNQILALVKYWLDQSNVRYGMNLPNIEVRFDLKGSAAGQLRMGREPLMRFNAEIAAKHFEAFCQRTIPHEVAHLVAQTLAGRRRIRPHGAEWQQVMTDFGQQPSRCHSYDLAGVAVKKQQRFPYQCQCRQHELSATRHYRVLRGLGSYRCTHCGSELKQSPSCSGV